MNREAKGYKVDHAPSPENDGDQNRAGDRGVRANKWQHSAGGLD